MMEGRDEVKHDIKEIRLKVDGMMCQKNCGTTVENALMSIEGAINSQAIYELSFAIVSIDMNTFDEEDVEEVVIDTIECIGFDCRLLNDGEELTPIETYVDDELEDVSFTISDEESGGIQVIYQIIGMSCTVCTTKVERTLLNTSYVSSARVNLSSAQAKVELSHPISNVEKSQQLITSLGYECRVLQVKDNNTILENHMNSSCILDPSKEEMKAWLHLLLVSFVFTIPLMIIHFMGMRDMNQSFCTEWIMFILSTPVQFYVGKRFYIAAYRNIIHGCILGMDALIVLGTSASYLYSIIIFVLHYETIDYGTFMHPTFETSAMLLTFVTLGKYLEAYAKGKTAQALYKLLELQPSNALRIVNYNKNKDISGLETASIDLNQVETKNYLLVLPGNRIPTDGVLVATTSNENIYVDESAFSGEPFPVSKSIGDSVLGCSMNQLSTIVIKVTATGQDTVISQIISCMEEAQSQVAPIQNFADKVASLFAPFVITCSIITFILWYTLNTEDMSASEQFFNAFMSSISVIVVACPCALGLATPTAVMVGTGVGASHGLLIKGGNVLEKAQSVDTIVFDKTATITTGKAILNKHHDLISDDELNGILGDCPVKDNVGLWLASCAESTSEHPLSIAIVNAAKSIWGADYTHALSNNVHVKDNKIYPGDGVECRLYQETWGNYMVRVGRKDWVLDNDNRINPTGDELAQKLRNEGQIVVFLSIKPLQTIQNFQIISLFSIQDPIKSTAQPCIQTLLNMNIDVWLCTGDHTLSAHHVANEVGIDIANVCANVSPQGKADFVRRLQSSEDDGYYHENPSFCSRLWSCRNKKHHRVVAMVGDGINDAVALATADVGIAIGAGTEIAMEAASIVLIQNSLYDVITALHLSRKVFHRIKWNFFWALCYNVCSLPIAAGVLYPICQFKLSPAFAGLMMAFSSVSVVVSSLLLRCYSKPKIQTGKDGKLLSKRRLSLSDGGSCCSTLCCWKSTETEGRYVRYDSLRRNSSVDGLEMV